LILSFINSGVIAPLPTQVAKPNGLSRLPFLLGLRYEVQPRMNLRIDFGIGKDSNSLYVSFTEAF
jgi:hypothetical protein